MSKVEVLEHAIVPASNGGAVTPMDMLDRAVTSGAGIETIEKLMVLQERWQLNQDRRDFNSAIAAAKADIPVIIKDGTAHNSKKYATFAAIARVVDPIISRHGLGYRFRTKQDDRINVTCVLFHRGGHSEETTLSGPPDTSGNKNAIQAIGSTLTYLQRYSLVQMLGLAAAEDDDGKAAVSGDCLTEKQADDLRDMIEASGAPRDKFLKWAKVEKIEDIRASYYDSCIEAIRSFKKGGTQ